MDRLNRAAALPAVFVAVVLAACGSGQAPSPTRSTASAAATDPEASGSAGHCSHRAEYQYAVDVNGMDEVVVTCDIAYKDIAGQQATMDVYRPPDADADDALPLVVMVHGNVDIPELLPLEEHWKRYNYRLGLALAAMGYVAISFDYRGYRNPATFAAAQEDVLDLLEFVRDGAVEYGIDPERVCLWGTSGGGLTMGWAAIHAEPPVSCAIGFSVSMEQPSVPDRDPVAALRADSPPFFLARGNLDGYARLRDFVERAGELGVEVVAEEHPRGRHGFEGAREPEQQRILARAFEFLEEHLGGV